MVIRLDTQRSDFPSKFQQFIQLRASDSGQVAGVVADIIKRVRAEGDKAVLDYTKKFDRFDATLENVKVTPHDIADALALCQPELMTSLKVAAGRIREYSQRQMPQNLDYTDELGMRLGHRWSAVESVGLYVPGGLAAYPSSVLMNAIPAKVAGVPRLVMVVPAPDGKLNPSILAAAHVAGIEEIYKIGGAQAIAALAYGTATIQPVDKIVGPGNAYVSEAKRQVFGRVGIDMIAGPSEILVIADNKNNPAWIAADLLSQAEHSADAQSVLITDDAKFADAVEKEIARILETLPRREIAEASWKKYGAIMLVEDWGQAVAIANEIAPEHVELAVENPDALLLEIRNAGAIFLGRHTPEAIGDYIAGPSHVLPTSRTARFSSGLSVFDFLKRSSLIGCSPEALAKLNQYVEVLAVTEGLDAHALSVTVRKNSLILCHLAKKNSGDIILKRTPRCVVAAYGTSIGMPGGDSESGRVQHFVFGIKNDAPRNWIGLRSPINCMVVHYFYRNDSDFSITVEAVPRHCWDMLSGMSTSLTPLLGAPVQWQWAKHMDVLAGHDLYGTAVYTMGMFNQQGLQASVTVIPIPMSSVLIACLPQRRLACCASRI